VNVYKKRRKKLLKTQKRDKNKKNVKRFFYIYGGVGAKGQGGTSPLTLPLGEKM